MKLNELFLKIDAGGELSREDLIFLLGLSDEKQKEAFFKKAYDIKLKNVGSKVFFRGIVEFSNICEKDCFYCGLRKSNKNNQRYMMSKDEIIDCAMWAFENEYGSIVLQSGERSDRQFVDFVEDLLKTIKDRSGSKLGITICLGEQSEETYRRWFEAGAHRYLLRIETSNPELYKTLHPEDHDFFKRRECLEVLKKIGYQTGTGVMMGLPGQTLEDLADDILFFKKMDIDMLGMGPYIVHNETPLAEKMPNFEDMKDEQFALGLKMIAATRVFLQDVNIAATTALQALHPQGREMGLKAGANVIMPNLTDTKYRASYQLYEDKPCIDENSSMCRGCLERRITGIGEMIGYNEWGDSPHFFKKK
jgi:biotin synthase